MADVLVVDDDVTVREVVVSYLLAAGHQVSEAPDGAEALQRYRERPADLVILDLLMPQVGGLEVCAKLRAMGDVPIIMLTALGAESNRVVGLEAGADDYIIKPFSPRELVLRVNALLRRSGELAPAPAEILTDGDLRIDRGRHEASLGTARLNLTTREFDLLAFFVTHPGTAYSREDLLNHVWGWTFGDHSTVTVHVRRLREKVETDPTNPTRLVTVWGVGYRWEAHHE